MSASSQTTHHAYGRRDPLSEWVNLGIFELSIYLARHAMFAEFCAAREARNSFEPGSARDSED